MSDKLNDIIQISKLGSMIAKDEKTAKRSKALVVILAVIGAVVVLGGIGYAIYRLLHRFDDNYDLYDDLDYYYDDDDHYDSEGEAQEEDFAE